MKQASREAVIYLSHSTSSDYRVIKEDVDQRIQRRIELRRSTPLIFKQRHGGMIGETNYFLFRSE